MKSSARVFQTRSLGIIALATIGISSFGYAGDLPFSKVQGTYKVVTENHAGHDNDWGLTKTITLSSKTLWNNAIRTEVAFVHQGQIQTEGFTYGEIEYDSSISAKGRDDFGEDERNLWAVSTYSSKGYGSEIVGTCVYKKAFLISKTPIKPGVFHARWERSASCDKNTANLPANWVDNITANNYSEDFEIRKVEDAAE